MHMSPAPLSKDEYGGPWVSSWPGHGDSLSLAPNEVLARTDTNSGFPVPRAVSELLRIPPHVYLES